MFTLRELLELMGERRASDLHLTVGSPPQLRIDGRLQRTDMDALTPEMTKKLAYSVMNEKQRKRFEETWELDLSFGIENLSRFRCNLFFQRGNVAIAIRQIPYQIPSFEELGLPRVVSELAGLPRGLVLVTGPTGSGKSTTLATLIDKINREQYLHIITVEDPIEYLHRHQCSLINQREVGADTLSFPAALKYALREDPDVCLIGEMRDLETVESALNISETGHLAFATLHTNSCAETMNRIIDVFPVNQQEQVRVTLSFVLQAIICQQLIPRVGGGRVVATEILICTPAIRATIRDDKIHQIYSLIQAGQKFGMRTMNQSLAELYLAHKITYGDGIARSANNQELDDLIARAKATGTTRARTTVGGGRAAV
jgi:twitching motility protein PilT